MAKVENVHQALDETAILLTLKKYRDKPDEINNIARKLMVQLLLEGVYKKLYGRIEVNESERESVASELGVGEKVLRDWTGAKGITHEHLITLARYYVHVWRLA